MALQIGILVFPGVQQLDLTGPYEVFASLPEAKVHLIWKDRAPINSATGLVLGPTMTFSECPALDVICVPGGGGVNALLQDAEVLSFLRAQAAAGALRHLGLHRLACPWRRGPAQGPQGDDALVLARLPGKVRRHPGPWPRGARRQFDHRGRRDGWHRFRAGGRRRAGRPGGGGSDPAWAGICAGAALHRRNTGRSTGRGAGNGARAPGRHQEGARSHRRQADRISDSPPSCNAASIRSVPRDGGTDRHASVNHPQQIRAACHLIPWQ